MLHPEQILLVVLITTVAALAVGRILRIAELYKQIQDQETDAAENPCPPHKWIYINMDTTGTRLHCSRCKYTPGTPE